MSKVDWSLAPEGATHAGTKHAEGIVCWYKLSNDSYHYWYMVDSVLDSCGWDESEGRPCHWPLVERPQPKPWSGPEDGLPSVGMTVQVWDKEPHKFYAKHCGKSVEILAHRTGSYGEVVAVYCVRMDDGTDEYLSLIHI